MNIVVPRSPNSLIMQEMRVALKKKAAPGQATLSRKEANRTWREDILGILSEDQKTAKKAFKQQQSAKRLHRSSESESED